MKYRLKMALSYHRPAWLREYIPALRNFLDARRKASLPAAEDRVLLDDHSMPYMRRFFALDHVRDARMASRINALELLGQHFGMPSA